MQQVTQGGPPVYRISAIWMNQMPCSITSIARTVGSRAPAGFDEEPTLQATYPDAAYSFNLLMKICHVLLLIIARALRQPQEGGRTRTPPSKLSRHSLDV